MTEAKESGWRHASLFPDADNFPTMSTPNKTFRAHPVSTISRCLHRHDEKNLRILEENYSTHSWRTSRRNSLLYFPWNTDVNHRYQWAVLCRKCFQIRDAGPGLRCLFLPAVLSTVPWSINIYRGAYRRFFVEILLRRSSRTLNHCL